MSKKIIIDAGHGGSDIGTSGNGLREKDLSLKISSYIYDKLKKLGYDVSLVRDSDITLNDDERVNKILDIYGNNSDVILISNHFDSDDDLTQVIYALRNNNELSDLIYDELLKMKLNVKEPYQLRLPSDTSKDYYYIHRNTGKIQPIMIQYGNLDDISFTNNIDSYYTKYGDAVVSALNSYLGGVGDNYYVVKAGDTLYSIAKKYNTTVDKLKSINNLSNSFLTIGQRLKINEISDVGVDENIYVVKSGDTLYSIARKYNVSLNDLLKYNNLNSSSLSIGQKLLIPDVSGDFVSEKTDYIIYLVKKGDTLYSISKKYGISVSDIMKFNNLTSNLLSIGQKLKIPVSIEEETVYVVKSGDNLYSIAKKYGTTVDAIKNKNNLTSNLLSIGQKLII